jgi:predicted amidohydrolase YtcJ
VIIRASDGKPTGELVEAATGMVKKHIPAPSPERVRSALEWAVQACNRAGITSLEEPSGDEVLLRGLQDLEKRHALTLDVAVYLMWGGQTFQRTSDSEVLGLIDRRKTYQSAHVDPNGVKIWLDGAPTHPYYTEADLDPITHTAKPDHLAINPDQLNAAVPRFDAAGLRVKMHVAGAGAARVALNAIEATRKANPRSTLRHQLAHNNLIAVEDMDRMKKLNATAEMSPALWQVIGTTLLDPPQKAWQFKSLKARGMLMTVGTDWALLDEPNLFPPLQGMLEHGDESIDLPFAIKMATLNGAVAVGAERDRGSIQAGKQASFIVLDRDLFAIKPADIGATKVLTTVFEGRVVYAADGGDQAALR